MEPSRVTVESLLAQRGWVRGLARTLVFDEHRADDVEQDAWLAALRSPPHEGGSLRAWFASVVRSRVHDQRRVDAHRTERETAAARPEATASAADLAASTEIHRRLTSALLALEEPYRSAVILRYFEDLPPREIAARMGVPVETARTHVKRGIERLRRRLDADHGGDRRAWCALAAPLAFGRATTGAVVGGTLVAKKTAVLAVCLLLLLLLLGASAIGLRSGSGVRTDVAQAPQPAATARPASSPRPERARAEATGTAATPPAAAAAPAPDHPVVAIVDAATRAPVEEARILVVHADGTCEQWPDGSGPSARYALDPSRVGGSVTIWVFAPGYARRRVGDVVLAAGVSEIALRRSAAVGLRFVTETGGSLSAQDALARFGGSVPGGAFRIVADDAIRSGGVLTMLRRLVGRDADWAASMVPVSDGAGLRFAEGLSPGRWRLFVSGPGATPWISEPLVVRDGVAPSVTVPLPDAPRTRRVRLLGDGAADPLAGAQLTPWLEFGDAEAFLGGVAIAAGTEGIAEVPYDPPAIRGASRPTTWWVRAPGRVGSFQGDVFDGGDAGGTVEVLVPRSAVVEGEAYLRSGAPAAGRRVVASLLGHACSAVADEDGRFRITDVPVRDGSVELMLLADETFTQARAAVGDDGVAHAVIGPQPAPGTRGRITGVVTAGGVPLAGILVLDQPTDAKGSLVRTDAAGRFLLDGLDARTERDLCIYVGDPRASEDHGRIRTTRALRVDPERPLEFVFDLPGGAASVKVLDAATGEAVVAAGVVAIPGAGAPDPGRFAGFEVRGGASNLTGDDGSVMLRALLPGAAHRVEVSADGYRPAEREGLVPGTDAAPATLEIRIVRR